MLVKSLHYKNFRQFKGENTLVFSCDKQKNVTIILGNNTFGKTTLLQMFNWCLYNKAIFRKEDNPDFLLNLEVSSKMPDSGDAETVLVEIVMLHDGKEYTVTRTQDYLKTNGVVSHRDSILKVAYKDIKTGKTSFIERTRDMESVINLILPEDLSGYFLFDTERVQNVADRKDLSSSVKGLLGLTVLDETLKHLGSESASTSVIGSFYQDLMENDDSKAKDALEKLQEAEEKLQEQTEKKEEAEDQIDTYTQQKEALEEKIRSLQDTTELQRRIDKLNSDIRAEKVSLEEASDMYRALFGEDAIWFFAQPLFAQANEFLDKAEINDKGISDVTADTIRELIKNGRCLCGAEVHEGNEAFIHLMEQIKYVPPESIGTTIKNFKRDIKKLEQLNAEDQYYTNLNNQLGLIFRTKKRISEWEEEVEVNTTKIAGKESAKQYQLELNDIKKRLIELNGKKELAIKKIGEAESDKDRFKKLYDALIGKSEKGKEIRRYLAYAIKIRDWVQEYYNEEEGTIRTQLQEKVNEIFKRMYHGERELTLNEKYQTVLYTKIEGSDELVISGESEGLIRVKNFAFIAGLVDLAKEKAISVGEKQLANEPYPLILDAPFSNADEEHIQNISRELPAVAEQVIMFVMEKDWKYAEKVILDKTGKTYKLSKHSDTYSTVE